MSFDPTNAELIKRIAPLYLTGSVIDVTYGLGSWWKQYRPANLIAADLDPDRADTLRADFTALPFPDSSVDSVAFDPPYIPHGGHDVTSFAGRFGIGGGQSRAAMDAQISDGLAECARVARRWVIVKCTDYTNGGAFHLGHVKVANVAADLGLTPWDLIVHATGPGPGHNLETQQRARRAHSYLLVYSTA